MRVVSTDDENDDIMDSSEVLNNLTDDEDLTPATPGDSDMTATKKTKTSAAEAKAPAKKAATKKALPEGFGPRAVPEGNTGLAALCEKLGLKPVVARRKLRSAEIGKPEGQHGWYWKDGSKDLAKIEKVLSAKKEPAAAKE